MVRGDSELIIKQIKSEYVAKHPRLRDYRNVVLDALQFFTEIDLQVMPRGQNILVDGLANDDQIEDFLQCKNDFECTNIDLENDDEIVNKSVSESGSVNNIDSKELNESKVDADDLNENEIDSGIRQLKSNVLPRGLVPLEDLFDFNNVDKKMKIEASGKEVEECNIGTEEKPKMINFLNLYP
jgi:hypothetical protein